MLFEHHQTRDADTLNLLQEFDLMIGVTGPGNQPYTFRFNAADIEPAIEIFSVSKAKFDLTAQTETLLCDVDEIARDPQASLIALAAFFSPADDADEVVLRLLNDQARLHICVHGNHARIMRGDVEFVYWNCDEFEENPGDVMGALFGALYQYA